MNWRQLTPCALAWHAYGFVQGLVFGEAVVWEAGEWDDSKSVERSRSA